MSTTKNELPHHLPAAIARLREIVAEAGDALLTEGDVHPDHRLLDLCAEVLHHLKAAERAYASRDRTFSKWTEADRAADAQLMHTYHDGIKRAQPPLRLVAKLPAKTAAGIYAKAMVCRASATGAAGLAMSLAEDLVACEELRKMLWPAAEAV